MGSGWALAGPPPAVHLQYLSDVYALLGSGLYQQRLLVY